MNVGTSESAQASELPVLDMSRTGSPTPAHPHRLTRTGSPAVPAPTDRLLPLSPVACSLSIPFFFYPGLYLCCSWIPVLILDPGL